MRQQPRSLPGRRAGKAAPATDPSALRGLLLCGIALAALAGTDALAQQKRTVRTVTGIEAMRLLYQHRRYGEVVKGGYIELWKDICRPDVLLLLGSALEHLGSKDDAAVYYTLALRAQEQGATSGTRASRKTIQAMLARVDTAHKRRMAEYLRTAAGKRFASPEKVDDLWMSQVSCDLHCLHGLYAWKLVGGRRDVKADWIHNRQGRMHRSGMKHVDEVDGRKGVLFGIPVKARTSKDADKYHRAILDRLGHATQITTRNPGRCRFLRIGTKAYGFAFIMKVYVSGREVFSRRIDTNNWSDLKIDLAAAGRPAPVPASAEAATRSADVGEGERVTVELVVPEKQRWSEGAWIDYIDFFEN